MKIAAINCVLPSNEIDNEEVIDLACYHSRSVYKGGLPGFKTAIRRSLDATGIRSRFWRSKAERPLDLINQSWKAVMASGVQTKDVDTIIYVGIDRGFIEPANACFIARRLGMTRARAFDIVDGCMGWCSALHVSQALLDRGDARSVLVVSSECPMDEGGIILPRSFTLSSTRDLRWKFPALTVGEAVSTTLLTRSEHSCKFHFLADSDKADLCTIPLYKFSEYSDDSEKLRDKQQFDFSAYGFNLYVAGYPKALAVLRDGLKHAATTPTLILPHSVSSRIVTRTSERLGLHGRFFSTFATTGNIATCSIPANIHFAICSGKLRAGDSCLGWVSSGGMKHAAFDIHL
jgi:3-oxoacyl-[acyl-carrier-protein] synthase III